MGIFSIFRRKVMPAIAVIAALQATLPKQTQAQYVDYLKKNDPKNIILVVQKEMDQRRKQFRMLKEQMNMKDTKFLDFEFSEWEKICNSIDISSPRNLNIADALIKDIAGQIIKIGESLDVKIDLRGLLKLKLHRAHRDMDILKKNEQWKAVVQRYFGLYCLSKHLGFSSQKRLYKRLFQDYSILLR